MGFSPEGVPAAADACCCAGAARCATICCSADDTAASTRRYCRARCQGGACYGLQHLARRVLLLLGLHSTASTSAISFPHPVAISPSLQGRPTKTACPPTKPKELPLSPLAAPCTPQLLSSRMATGCCHGKPTHLLCLCLGCQLVVLCVLGRERRLGLRLPGHSCTQRSIRGRRALRLRLLGRSYELCWLHNWRHRCCQRFACAGLDRCLAPAKAA